MGTNELIDKHREAVNDYNKSLKELANIKKRKAFKIIELRAGSVKSYADAERVWETTDDGQKEIELSFKCKGLEKVISQINIELRSIRDEYWGQN